jgi:IS6 family transposase
MPTLSPKNQPRLFKYHHYQTAIILRCVRWHLRYSLSYRDLEEIMAERGLSVDHTIFYQWVQHYAPMLEKKCHAKLRPPHDSWRVDETCVRVKGQCMYLYRTCSS